MILWYRFKNFYSYRDDTTIDLSLKKNSPETSYDFNFDGKRFSKVLAVMGGNGSGKSNLLRPLAFLSWLCASSFKSQEKNDLMPFYPCLLTGNEQTEIEICFSLPFKLENRDTFKYHVVLNKNSILKEELKVKNKKNNFISIFKRVKVDNEFKIKVNKEYSDDTAFPLGEIKFVPDNVSVISYMGRRESSVPSAMFAMFAAIFTNLNVHGRNSFNYGRVLQTAESYHEHVEIFNSAIKLMKDMDFGIADIKLKEEELIDSEDGKVVKKIMPYGVHYCDGDYFEVPFRSESSGTQALFSFALPLLLALQVGGVAVMDEIDCDLHPLMVLSILSLFEDENINKFNAQLIFSCHTPEILKRLKKHHVYLVEKVNSISEPCRMDDIIGLRSQDNLYSKYMTGALGGVPDISL